MSGAEILVAHFLMVTDHLLDDEAEELLAEFRIEFGLFGECAQARDLALLPRGIGGRKRRAGLVPPHRLGDPEAFGEHVDERCIDVVDALAKACEHRVGSVLARRAVGVIHRGAG